MWCCADGWEIPDVSNRNICFHIERFICLRKPLRRKHEDSSKMHQKLIQRQTFPCQKTRIVQADCLLHPVWVLFYCNLKRGTLIAICVAEWGCTVFGPREGGCRGSALWLLWEWQLPRHPVYLCYNSATMGATKRGFSFKFSTCPYQNFHFIATRMQGLHIHFCVGPRSCLNSP